MTTPKRKLKAKPAAKDTAPKCASQFGPDLTPLQIALRTNDPWRVANELQNQGMNELAEFLYGLDVILDHSNDEYGALEQRTNEEVERLNKEIDDWDRHTNDLNREASKLENKLGEALMKIQDLETELELLR